MAKAALMLTSILLLAFSAGLTGTRPDQILFSQSNIASFSIGGQTIADGAAAMAVSPQKSASPTAYTAEDLPAPALLVYLAFILIVSAIAVMLVRHTHPRQHQ